MALIKQMITPCLWFDSQAEEAANFYCSVFNNSKVTQISRYPEAGQETHKKPPGSVMVVALELDGQPFTALNGGPNCKFDEAVSFQVLCQAQKEIDHFWTRLTGDGGQEGPCGWLKDKFGLSWQVGPDRHAPHDGQSGQQEIRARHERIHEDEEARPCRARARLCWASSMNAPHGGRTIALTSG